MNLKKIIAAIFILLFFAEKGTSADTPYSYKKQSSLIRSIIKREKSTTEAKKIIKLVKNIDNIYGNLYENLLNNKKIVIFFDPAHGKLPGNIWQGGRATGRLSCTNKPEEYYSMVLSKAMYKLLSSNKFIDVKSTPDFMEVLKGKSDTYKNIPFNKTVKLAKKEGAFILISEHLNNVSMFNKASGRVNIPGLHITRNRYGKKFLRYVPRTYDGFLTLYNKLDSSGFSKKYALKLKEKLVQAGFKPNYWQKGAVGDDRFSYFVDFPISIIYESAFISNPAEEKMLRDETHVEKLVNAQYKALLENINEVFGVDISGEKPVKNTASAYHRLELLKLSRIAVFYLKNRRTADAISTINKMVRAYRKTKYREYLTYFIDIRKRIYRAEKYFKISARYKRYARYHARKKNYRKARRFRIIASRNLIKARRYLNKPIFLSYRKKFYNKTKKHKRKIYRKKIPRALYAKKKKHLLRRRTASRYTPIIFSVEENQSLEDALINALNPNKKTLKKLLRKFKNVKIVKWVRYRKYSKKRKRMITYWRKRIKRVKFKKGIYIVKMNRHLTVTDVKPVGTVSLNRYRYQNQQYLNNSYFSFRKKIKAL